MRTIPTTLIKRWIAEAQAIQSNPKSPASLRALAIHVTNRWTPPQ
jgi:hypothetical protein